MKYFDTGSRNLDQTLAYWLTGIVKEDLIKLRIQSGYFSIEAVGLLLDTFGKLSEHDLLTNIIIGSNDKATLKTDLVDLFNFLRLPRKNANLGVVSFNNALYHPKTYHFVRADGSQVAFVGSSNFSSSGLSLNVEAGLALDTREGDDPAVLTQIGRAVDLWFEEKRAGLFYIPDEATIEEITAEGIVGVTPLPRVTVTSTTSHSGSKGGRSSLTQLITLPRVTKSSIQGTPEVTSEISPPVTSIPKQTTLPSVQRDEFPHYILFEPSSSSPTYGIEALTGTMLGGDKGGIITKLNKDSARHFLPKSSGTANISVPVDVATTLRFGIYKRKYKRPRAEFNVRMRYLSDTESIQVKNYSTNIMGYGFTREESGHCDIRMVVRAPQVKELKEHIQSAGYENPKVDDLAILEWPEPSSPQLSLSFIDTKSKLYNTLQELYDRAEQSGAIVGKGACWLPLGTSPSW